jgi:hypothetical protein
MNKEIISPVLKEVEAINTMLNQLNRKLGEAEKTRTLLNEETLNEQKILDYKQEIKVLRKVIDDLTKESTSASMVKSRFLEILNSILANILHLDEKLLDLDEEYLPVFEEGRLSSKAGREDIDKSKSVKKILGYYTAVVEFSLKYGSFHPRLLLLDTPRQDELDFTIFSKILEYWIDLKHYGKPYQIVITGAEFPITIKTIAEFHNPVASEDYSKPEKYSVM